jgi:hypothetical protein
MQVIVNKCENCLYYENCTQCYCGKKIPKHRWLIGNNNAAICCKECINGGMNPSNAAFIHDLTCDYCNSTCECIIKYKVV